MSKSYKEIAGSSSRSKPETSSLSYKDVNRYPEGASQGYLFIEAKELESVYKAPYSVLFILCIAASYILLLPPALLSTGYALAIGWIGVGWLVKKYLLQDRLISKGDIGAFEPQAA